jgi:hypothetical protein
MGWGELYLRVTQAAFVCVADISTVVLLVVTSSTLSGEILLKLRAKENVLTKSLIKIKDLKMRKVKLRGNWQTGQLPINTKGIPMVSMSSFTRQRRSKGNGSVRLKKKSSFPLGIG